MKTPPASPPRCPPIDGGLGPNTPNTSRVRPTVKTPIAHNPTHSETASGTGVSLSSRVRQGSKDACLHALDLPVFSNDAQFKKNMNTLLSLIDRNRRQELLSNKDRQLKQDLQDWAAEEISKNSGVNR